MNRTSDLIDWTATNTFNATATTNTMADGGANRGALGPRGNTIVGANNTMRKRLTIEELNAKINYPVYKKPQEKMEPLRTDIGRRALEIFHNQKRSFGITSRVRATPSNNHAAANGSNVYRSASTTSSKGGAKRTNTTGATQNRGDAAPSSSSLPPPHPLVLPPHVPLADLPTLSPAKLDEELTRYLEAIATGGASEGYYGGGGGAGNGGGVSSQQQQQSAAPSSSSSSYNEGETYLGAAVILQLKGRFADALSYYSKCVSADPLISDCYLHRAECFTRLERPAEALEEYKKYLQIEPATKALLADCGKCALDADRLDEAEQLFLACLSINAPSVQPMADTTLTTLDGTIIAAGAASVAALLLRNRQQQMLHGKVCSVVRDPSVTNIKKNCAAMTLSAQQRGGGGGNNNNNNVSCVSDASSTARFNASAAAVAAAEGLGAALEEEAAAALAETGDDWNVSDDIPMAAEGCTHDSYSFYNLGEVEERRGNTARAGKYYSKVHPSFAAPYYDQGRQEFANENYPAALRLFEAVAKVLPEEVSVHLWLADTYTALGINEFSLCVLSCLTRAIALPEKVSTVPPDMVDQLVATDPDCRHMEPTLLRRGMLYLNILNDVDSALTDFSLCLAQNPRNSDALLSRARALLLRNNAGDEEAAIADYELVVTIASVPQSEKAHPYEILGLFYEKKKRYVEAGRFLALSVCAGVQPPARSLYRCATHTIVSTAPTTVNGAEELPLRAYDARGWIPKPDGSEADPKKKAASGVSSSSAALGGGGGGVSASSASPVDGGLRSAAVMPLSYSVIDSYYAELKSREPTVHRRDECSAIDAWKPVRAALDKRKEEAEAAKNTKKKKR